jgi:4-hydroxy-tetrahydrodipicolinate synthase
VALVTLFSDNGDLEPSATADLAAQLVGLGVKAVVVAGTTGEASALTLDERTELIAAVRKVIPEGSGVPLIAGTGAPSAGQAALITQAAYGAGADAVLAMAAPGAADQRPYYQAVAAAAAGMPVLGYHYPKVSAPGIAIEQLVDLPITGLKDSSGDPGRLLQTRDRWKGALYSGSPALITMANAIGCEGAILGLANVEPEACVAAFEGDGRAQLALAKAMNTAQGRFPGGLKDLVAARFATSTATRMG